MTKSKSTKRALWFSALALLLCISLLVGTTFAWFTDSVSSMNNVIKSGELVVTMEYSKDGENWVEITEDTSIFNEDTFWEPGSTEVVALRIKNEGTLGFKYALSTNINLEEEGTNVYGENFKLSEHLSVYACEPQSMDVIKSILTNRDNAVGDSGVMVESGFNLDLVSGKDLAVDQEHVVCVAITMPKEAGNVVNYKTGTTAPTVSFGVNLYATQTTLESDDFGADYDKDATFNDGLNLTSTLQDE